MSGRSDERRRSERLEVDARVSLKRGGRSSVLPVGNVSAGGVFLEVAPGQLPGVALGEEVRVYIDFGADNYGDPLELEVDAEVVRVDLGGPDRKAGIALMWTSDDPEVAQQLVLVLDLIRGR